MQKVPMNYRLFTSLIRTFLSLSIYSTIFYDFGFLDLLCGPMAIPSPAYLYPKVIIIQLFNIHYGLLASLLLLIFRNQMFQKLAKSYTIKYLILLLLKIYLIVLQNNHRRKYYFHSFLLELVVIGVCLFFDFSGNKNIMEILELTLIDMLNKTSVLYQVTRTFCPKFALYWFFSNLLYLVLSQIQSHIKRKNYLDNPPLYRSSLYVKQDIHRFLIFIMIYFGLFSYLQGQVYGYGMLLVGILTVFPFYKAVKYFDQGEESKSMGCLFVVALCMVGMIYLRINMSYLFKPLFLAEYSCRNDPVAILNNAMN